MDKHRSIGSQFRQLASRMEPSALNKATAPGKDFNEKLIHKLRGETKLKFIEPG